MSPMNTDMFRTPSTAEAHPDRFARLPKWAQDRITLLERSVEHYQDKLAEGPAESNTFSDPHSAAPRPLGTDPTVDFIFGDGHEDKISCRIESGYLYVNGGKGLAVHPQSSNAFRIALLHR